jgi:hypothetical protein
MVWQVGRVWSPEHAKLVLSCLDWDIFPFLDNRPVA